MTQFSLADFIVFGLGVLASMATGLYFALTGSKVNSTKEFFMAGRKMSSKQQYQNSEYYIRNWLASKMNQLNSPSLGTKFLYTVSWPDLYYMASVFKASLHK